jgi:hypothetical protein
MRDPQGYNPERKSRRVHDSNLAVMRLVGDPSEDEKVTNDFSRQGGDTTLEQLIKSWTAHPGYQRILILRSLLRKLGHGSTPRIAQKLSPRKPTFILCKVSDYRKEATRLVIFNVRHADIQLSKRFS